MQQKVIGYMPLLVGTESDTQNKKEYKLGFAKQVSSCSMGGPSFLKAGQQLNSTIAQFLSQFWQVNFFQESFKI